MHTIKVTWAKTLWQKTKGLLGTKSPYPLLLQTRFGIHTFGMKFPIDILILDNKNKIRAVKENLKPNRLYLWNPKYKRIIELPNHTISSKKIEKGETIQVITV